jgi:hypothetical protein
MRTPHIPTWLLTAALVGLTGCGTDTARDATEESQESAPAQIVLGPADGHDLSGTALERVQVGDPAPDFSLASLAGPVITLSDFRGAKDVVLVFYRGHW